MLTRGTRDDGKVHFVILDDDGEQVFEIIVHRPRVVPEAVVAAHLFALDDEVPPAPAAAQQHRPLRAL